MNGAKYREVPDVTQFSFQSDRAEKLLGRIGENVKVQVSKPYPRRRKDAISAIKLLLTNYHIRGVNTYLNERF